MIKHYAISAIRHLKKFNANATMNCLLMVLCMSLLIISAMYLFAGVINKSHQLLLLTLILFSSFIAGINYYNLSSLQFLRRKNELSLRLIFGADYYELYRLMLVEVIVRLFVALILSLVLSDLLLPVITQFTKNDISLKHDFNWKVIPFIICFNILIIVINWINFHINRGKILIGFQQEKKI